MIKVKLGPGYEQVYRDLVQDDQEFRDYVTELVELFRKNPQDTRLDNHVLTKKMEGKCSFSITEDIRIIYEWVGLSTVRFLDIGPHAKVYRKIRIKKTISKEVNLYHS